MIKSKLTDANVAALAGRQERYLVYDTEMPGLIILVHPTGKKSWVVHKTVAYQKRIVTLGWFPVMTTSEARKHAAKVIAALLNGQEVTGAWKTQKTFRPTFRILFKEYAENHLKQNATAKTYRENKRLVETKAGKLADLPVDGLIPGQVQAWINNITLKSPASAAKMLSIFRATLNWACKMGHTKVDALPFKDVSAPKSNTRTAYVKPGDEFQLLKAALDEEAKYGSQDAVDLVWLALYTAARKANLMAMAWSEIDFKNELWIVPAEKAKAGKDIAIPLDTRALSILNRRRDNGSQWVFPSDEAISGHVEDISKPWNRIREAAGITDLTFHGLRHTTATMLGIGGESSLTISKALGHASITMSEKYTHRHVEPVRKALETAMDRLER